MKIPVVVCEFQKKCVLILNVCFAETNTKSKKSIPHLSDLQNRALMFRRDSRAEKTTVRRTFNLTYPSNLKFTPITNSTLNLQMIFGLTFILFSYLFNKINTRSRPHDCNSVFMSSLRTFLVAFTSFGQLYSKVQQFVRPLKMPPSFHVIRHRTLIMEESSRHQIQNCKQTWTL